MAGLLDMLGGGMNSPLTHAGLGLLSANAKQMAYDPAQLRPSGIGPGLLAGVNSYNQYQGGQQEQELARQKALAMQQRNALGQSKIEMEQRKAQREQKLREDMAVAMQQGDMQKAALIQAELGNATMLNQQVAPAKPPSSVQEYEYAKANDPSLAGISYTDWDRANKKTAASNISLSTGGAFKAQTKPGRSYQDLQNLLAQPPTPERDATIAALKLETQNAGQSAEQTKKVSQMESVRVIADEFMALADKNEASTGSIAGSLTKLQTSDGLLGRAYRVFSDPTEDEAQMAAMEAQMRALLGNALSGATIPESEWPTYQAQVPSVTDVKSSREGKAKAFGGMMSALFDAAKARDTTATDLTAAERAELAALRGSQ